MEEVVGEVRAKEAKEAKVAKATAAEDVVEPKGAAADLAGEGISPATWITLHFRGVRPLRPAIRRAHVLSHVLYFFRGCLCST